MRNKKGISAMINPDNPPINAPTPWGHSHAKERFKRRTEERLKELSVEEANEERSRLRKRGLYG